MNDLLEVSDPLRTSRLSRQPLLSSGRRTEMYPKVNKKQQNLDNLMLKMVNDQSYPMTRRKNSII